MDNRIVRHTMRSRMLKREESPIMTEREKQQGQPMETMREKSQPGKYMNEGRLTVVVVALAILTFLGILSETCLLYTSPSPRD